jgi:hypothetical protein
LEGDPFMDQVNSIENKLREIVSKLDEIRELLNKHQKKEPGSQDKIFEPILKAPHLSN